MTSHTPGPWILGDVRGVSIDGIPVKAYNKRYDSELAIFNVPSNDNFGGVETAKANAQLIAAAPELLEALRVLVDHSQEKYPHFESERGQRDIQQALDAIAKAEGSK